MEYKIKEISYDETWPIRHEVLWPNKPMNYIHLPNDVNGLHYGLFLNKKLVSVLSLFPDKQIVQLRKFATIPDYQNRGLGTKLLSYAILELNNGQYQKIWCNARVNSVNFYQKFGFVKSGKPYFKDGIQFVRMEMLYL